MLHPSTKRLIDKLDEMTRKQRVGWQESDDGAVRHDTEGYRVTLTAAPHALLLTDTQGREIETCSPEDFVGETDATGRPYAEFIEDLYREAHRHARGAEKAISALLSSLDEADAEDVAAPVVADAPHAEPETFEHAEDEGDESRPLEDHEMPEFEGQADMQAAVAAMADEVNAEPVSPAAQETALATDSMPVVEPAMVAEPEQVEALTPSEPVAPSPVPEEPAAPYAPFAGSTETARPYAVAAEFAAPAVPEPEAIAEEAPVVTSSATELPAAEPFSGENDVWNAIRGTSEPVEEAAPAAEPTAPEMQPQLQEEPVAPAASRPAPVFGAGLFASSMGDLSRYRTETPATPEADEQAPPEPAPEPAPVEQAASEAPQAPEAEPAPAFEADITPEPEPERPAPAPAAPQSFSLSGITSGFGLGSTHSAHRPQPEAPVTTAEPQERKIIDGTVDLPDSLPEAEPAPASGMRMEEDEDFGFTDADLMPGVEASPVPAASEAAPDSSAPAETASEPEAEPEPLPPHRPTQRFNPWN
ncbi:MAG: hypothetical protein R3B94_11330 [Hyphomonas sp.]